MSVVASVFLGVALTVSPASDKPESPVYFRPHLINDAKEPKITPDRTRAEKSNRTLRRKNAKEHAL